jgi:hypothetical protein
MPSSHNPGYADWLRWWWRRWRAAHHEWAAWVDYLRWPSLGNQQRLARAADHLRQLDDNRP